MGIDPSVPVGSAIMPKALIGSWAYLLYLPLLSRKKAVRHTFTVQQDGEEVVLLARVEAATGNTLAEHLSRQEQPLACSSVTPPVLSLEERMSQGASRPRIAHFFRSADHVGEMLPCLI
jgi:hypothetical protein